MRNIDNTKESKTLYVLKFYKSSVKRLKCSVSAAYLFEVNKWTGENFTYTSSDFHYGACVVSRMEKPYHHFDISLYVCLFIYYFNFFF